MVSVQEEGDSELVARWNRTKGITTYPDESTNPSANDFIDAWEKSDFPVYSHFDESKRAAISASEPQTSWTWSQFEPIRDGYKAGALARWTQKDVGVSEETIDGLVKRIFSDSDDMTAFTHGLSAGSYSSRWPAIKQTTKPKKEYTYYDHCVVERTGKEIRSSLQAERNTPLSHPLHEYMILGMKVSLSIKYSKREKILDMDLPTTLAAYDLFSQGTHGEVIGSTVNPIYILGLNVWLNRNFDNRQLRRVLLALPRHPALHLAQNPSALEKIYNKISCCDLEDQNCV